ncbi:MAG TPA: NAD(P)-binding domain-containing protein [Thermoanaerobaculia bacterium]
MNMTSEIYSATGGEDLPVVVIGAGPVGLAAAAHLLTRGETPLVVEAGDEVAANIRRWAHVRLFSPWRYNVDAVSAALLERHGWSRPDPESYPTGGDLVERYLEPLAATPEMSPHIRLGARVTAISRLGFDKMKTAGREKAPFLVSVRRKDGSEEAVLARAVIDASGTWATPNPLGSSGVPAAGERNLSDRIFYGIPDVLGAYRERYAGRTVLVVGSGHSAFNAVLDLAQLAAEAPGTSIVWAIRRSSIGQLFGGGENDKLAARGLLGVRVRQLVESGTVRLVTGFKAYQVRAGSRGLEVAGDTAALSGIDEIVVSTGARPDLSILSELRLDLDPGVESPSALAPLIDPNLHSCGTVRPHGAEELKQPEPGFFIVGMKSYGRAPTFLMLTGYEQVRSVVSALAGDWEAAREVRLELPETGVCSVGPLVGAVEKAAACCGPAAVGAGAAVQAAAKAAGGERSCGCAPTCCSTPEEEAQVVAARQAGAATCC